MSATRALIVLAGLLVVGAATAQVLRDRPLPVIAVTAGAGGLLVGLVTVQWVMAP